MKKACLVLTVLVLTVFALSGCKQEDDDNTTNNVVVPDNVKGKSWGWVKDGYNYIVKIYETGRAINFERRQTGIDPETGVTYSYVKLGEYTILEVQTVSEVNRTTLFCNKDKTKDYVVCEGNEIIIVSFGEYYFSKNTMN
jgi:hypothetical protein